MKIIGALLLIIGIVLGLLSTKFELYSDEDAFNDQYYNIDSQHEDASIQFHELRHEYLTPKTKLIDYSLTLLQLGFVLLLFSIIKPVNIRVPGKKATVIVIGVLAVLLSTVGFVGDLFLEMRREVYPHWADSLAIPMMGVPVLVIVGLIWVAANSAGMRGSYLPGVAFLPLQGNYINYWYATICGITVLILLLFIAIGNFWYVIPGFLWIYFYTSIMIGQRVAKNNNES